MSKLDELNPLLRERLGRLLADSGGSVWINSGYRSIARQAILYAEAALKYGVANAGRYVAKPGRSNHNYREAADLGYKDDAARRWAHANAGKYNLHFPMWWENWHIERRDLKSRPDAYTTPPAGGKPALPEDRIPSHEEIEEMIGPYVDVKLHTGGGYWVFTPDGGVYAYGGAPFHGSMGGKLGSNTIEGVVLASDGSGYMLIGKDGGLFCFGSVKYAGRP